MRVQVDIRWSMTEIDGDAWDRVIDESGAPIFYRASFLHAYERFPLSPIDSVAYITIRDGGGDILGVAPAYCYPSLDPFGWLTWAGSPRERQLPALLSHAWHCYSTQIPSRAAWQEVYGAMSSAMFELARECSASWVGFINLDGESQFPQQFARLGLSVVPCDKRYILDLTPFREVEEFISSVASANARHNLRRHHRRFTESRFEVRLRHPRDADLEGVADLCAGLVSRFGIDAYYSRHEMPLFLEALGDRARVLELSDGSSLLGAFILFIDRDRLHMWGGGFDVERETKFSPYYILLYYSIQEALRRRVRFLEAGRRNDDFKRRYGMRPIQLFACLTRT